MRSSRLRFVLIALLITGGALGQPDGRKIYLTHCASCHGDKGQGAKDEYEEPLWGRKSVESLARYIDRAMPEEKEETVVDEDAHAVARYIYDEFLYTEINS